MKKHSFERETVPFESLPAQVQRIVSSVGDPAEASRFRARGWRLKEITGWIVTVRSKRTSGDALVKVDEDEKLLVDYRTNEFVPAYGVAVMSGSDQDEALRSWYGQNEVKIGFAGHNVRVEE